MKKFLFCLPLAGSMISCGENRAVIALEVGLVPQGAERIEATIEINGTIYSKEKIAPYYGVESGINRFLYTYPANVTGNTKIVLSAFGTQNCVIGRAAYEVLISNFDPINAKTSFVNYEAAEGTLRNLFSIWGSQPAASGGSKDVWAVGEVGTLLHWDGACWTDWTKLSGNTLPLGAIDGINENDVWTAGSEQTIGHWNGLKWDFKPRIAGSLSNGNVTSLRVFSSTDAWITGLSGDKFILYSWDGTAWIDRKNPTNTSNIETTAHTSAQNDKIYDIAGTKSANMMLAGFSRNQGTAEQAGLIYKCSSVAGGVCNKDSNNQDTKFYSIFLPTGADASADYTAAWTAGADDYWFGVGYGNGILATEGAVLVHWLNGVQTREVIDKTLQIKDSVDHIWGIRNSDGTYDLWVNVYNKDNFPLKSKVYRRERNGSFGLVQDAQVTNKIFNAIWGSSANDVWLVGNGGLRVHYDGKSYTTYP